MSAFWKTVFLPTDNRYVVGERPHAIKYIIESVVFVVLIVAFLIFTRPNWLWYVPLLIPYFVLDYYVFDKWYDKRQWFYVLSRHYQQHRPDTAEHSLIKTAEKSPTPENLRLLKDLGKK